MVADGDPVVTEDVNLLIGLPAAPEGVFRLQDVVHPASLDVLVEPGDDLGILEVFGIGLDRVDGRIPLLVGAVLLEPVEASGGFLGGLGDGLLEVASGGGDSADEGHGPGLPVVQDDHSGPRVKVGDDRGKVHGEGVGSGELLHPVGHLPQGLGPAGGRVGEKEAFQTHGPVIFTDGHGGVDRGLAGGHGHVGRVADDGGALHQVTAGVRVDQLRELREYLNDLVGPLAAGRHHDDVGLALLGDGVLEDGLAAAERAGDEPGASLGDRVEGVDAPQAGLHDLAGPGFLLVGFHGHLDGPFLGHGDISGLPVLVRQGSHDHVDVIVAGGDDPFDLELSLEGEGNHDLVGQPAFFHLPEPVPGDHRVALGRYRGELPDLVVVERVGVLAPLEEHALHRGEVVLQAVVHAGQQAGAEGDLKHLAEELDLIPVLEAPGALEHLHGGLVAVDLDDLGQQWGAPQSDVA